MTLGPPTLCVACARFDWRVIDDWGEPRCEAFPQGIPGAIFWGGADHRTGYPGDGGKRFRPNLEDPEWVTIVAEYDAFQFQRSPPG